MRSKVCEAHKHTTLVPVESHHVHPLGYHGPDTKANRVQICCNAHSDAHYLLERMLKTGNKVPRAERTSYGFRVRMIALRGYLGVMAYASEMSR